MNLTGVELNTTRRSLMPVNKVYDGFRHKGSVTGAKTNGSAYIYADSRCDRSPLCLECGLKRCRYDKQVIKVRSVITNLY
jgi:hypothetical protein